MEKIIAIANKLKTSDYNEEDGDNIIIKEIGDGCYYAFVSSKKRGFGSMFIDSKLTFLFFSSAIGYNQALQEFKRGRRS